MNDAPFDIRAAQPSDLADIVRLEINIANVSFGDKAIVDPAVHAQVVLPAIADDSSGTFVSVADGHVSGWLWVVERRNHRTSERYANLRSLATTDCAPAGTGDALLRHALLFAAERRLASVIGRVHVGNVAMRALYRRFDFLAEHLTVRLEIPQ